MADTGFLFPGTAVGARAITGSDTDWANPGNITADDASDATVGRTIGMAIPRGLAGSNFDFSSIPGSATIDGIEVRVGDFQRTADPDVVNWKVCQLILADDSDGSVTKHSVLSAWTASLQTSEAGGAADLWSETISDTDVKDVDWGFFVSVELPTSFTTSFIDFMQMKVFYTAAGGGGGEAHRPYGMKGGMQSLDGRLAA